MATPQQWHLLAAARTLALIAASMAVLTACGGSQANNGRTKPPDPTDIKGPSQPWETMTREAKEEYMVEQVMPIMAHLFSTYDQQGFQDFGCPTCHGADMQARNFEMPSPALPPLHPTGTPEQQQMVLDHPEMVRFMFNRVTPSMQALLGADAYDPNTGEGFTCFSCHTRANVPPQETAPVSRLDPLGMNGFVALPQPGPTASPQEQAHLLALPAGTRLR